ncbi:alpha/beta fold hydrolase [Agromyces atrinae]|uniref:alpha/beta fold hydrolase n=1 Tax=Agromyces atrinae TaxID=592376 RepID=UPI001F5894F6|nr:alpha/beta hydrolase [Agromyces atrinae]MCI2958594.1 alpha/beta fold hydrolase [Agromyces atrinae]
MQLNAETIGSGERHIGLVHGLGADGTTWRPLIDRLVATGRYTITTIDLRGHGRSDRAGSYGLDELAADVVDTLPTDLHSVVGHSLGGAVLVRAVGRLRPRHAIYLDPGFQLSLPTSGVAGRLFWAVPAVTLGVVGALQARRSARQAAAYDARIRGEMARSRELFDSSMAIGVFRDVAFHPIRIAAPEVPSTIVLSDESPAVLSDAMAAELEAVG